MRHAVLVATMLTLLATIAGCTGRQRQMSAPGVVTGIAAPCAGPVMAVMQSVTVFAIRDGRTIATQVTQYIGRRGRYRFVLAPGRYKISAPRAADKVPQVVLVHSRQTTAVNFPNNCY
jgi:hypothetical protein